MKQARMWKLLQTPPGPVSATTNPLCLVALHVAVFVLYRSGSINKILYCFA